MRTQGSDDSPTIPDRNSRKRFTTQKRTFQIGSERLKLICRLTQPVPLLLPWLGNLITRSEVWYANGDNDQCLGKPWVQILHIFLFNSKILKPHVNEQERLWSISSGPIHSKKTPTVNWTFHTRKSQCLTASSSFWQRNGNSIRNGISCPIGKGSRMEAISEQMPDLVIGYY